MNGYGFNSCWRNTWKSNSNSNGIILSNCTRRKTCFINSNSGWRIKLLRLRIIITFISQITGVENIYLYWTAKETSYISKVSTNFILITIKFINQYRKVIWNRFLNITNVFCDTFVNNTLQVRCKHGLSADHGITSMSFCWRKSLVALAKWARMLSCWKV